MPRRRRPPWQGSTRAQRLPKDWPARSKRVRQRDPICRVCKSKPSTQADHITPGDDHSLSNLQGICDDCHKAKSAREGAEASARRHRLKRRPAEQHPGLIADDD